MPTSSRVLVIGHPQPQDLRFGAISAANFSQARKLLTEQPTDLIVFGVQPQFEEFCEFLATTIPKAKWILSNENLNPAQLIRWINAGNVANTIETMTTRELEACVLIALEDLDQKRQQVLLMRLFEEQSHNLKILSTDLEQRVQKRQKQLQKSQKLLLETNSQMEVVHRALLGIYRAKTFGELQQQLNQGLNENFGLEWTRILFQNQSSLSEFSGDNVLSIDIPLGRSNKAKFVTCKKVGSKFSSAETDLLFEVSESIGLALQRMEKLDEAETLKQQWEATFDAISHPLCLASADFKILRMNRALALKSKKKFKDLLGKNSFQVLLGKIPATTPTFPFRIKELPYEIAGQALDFELDGVKAHLILYRDVTEEHRLERRILDSTKLAELGTIGSSIAHELNNPLGGMLSFLQLIKMDLAKDAKLRPDIEDMEKSTLNCRDIIRNLLGFARKGDTDDYQKIDVKTVIERSIKLIELQSKSKGIRLNLILPDGPANKNLPVHGSLNNLSQAICNLLQNSIDSISDRMKVDPLYAGAIAIKVESQDSMYRIHVTDNGIGISEEHQTQIFNPLFTTRDPGLFSGMGLTTAFSIILEHAGRLEITSQTGSGTTAIISLTRPDFASNSQVFDGEI
jgi:two-component system NtrC family sensor kinase